MQQTLSCSEPPSARLRIEYSAHGAQSTLKQKQPGATHGASPMDTCTKSTIFQVKLVIAPEEYKLDMTSHSLALEKYVGDYSL